MSGISSENESELNSAGIFNLEQLALQTTTAVSSKLNGKIPFSQIEIWIAESKKITTEHKIVLLRKDMNLKKLFRKKP